MKDLVVLLKEQLDDGKTVSFIPKGNSMKPMLNGKDDVVFLKKPENKLKLHDVALYYRKETNSYSIHRVVSFSKNGTYEMLGDNNFKVEKNITHQDVLGVVTGYYHKNKSRSVNSFKYRCYCEFWLYSRPFRYLLRIFKSKFIKEK